VVTVTAGGWLVKKPGGQPDPRGFTVIAVEDGRILSVTTHTIDSGGAPKNGPRVDKP